MGTAHDPCCSSQTSTLIDLTTGERTAVANTPVASGLPAVASDGAVLFDQRNNDIYPRFGIWKQGSITPITTSNGVPVAISDDGRVVLLSSYSLFTNLLGVKDLSTGRETMFYQQLDDAEWAVFMGMSTNGSRILYRRMPEYAQDGRAYIYDLSSGKSLPILLAADELVSDGTLSASGEFAVVATTTGRLLRVNLADGAVTTLIPATPYVPNLFGLVPVASFICGVRSPVLLTVGLGKSR